MIWTSINRPKHQQLLIHIVHSIQSTYQSLWQPPPSVLRPDLVHRLGICPSNNGSRKQMVSPAPSVWWESSYWVFCCICWARIICETWFFLITQCWISWCSNDSMKLSPSPPSLTLSTINFMWDSIHTYAHNILPFIKAVYFTLLLAGIMSYTVLCEAHLCSLWTLAAIQVLSFMGNQPTNVLPPWASRSPYHCSPKDKTSHE